jgi:hypothetical protein
LNRLFNAYGPIVSLIWSVIGIELMVHWNHISGVYVLGQTGQLIPLVIGIGSMIKTFYSINNERWLLSVVSFLCRVEYIRTSGIFSSRTSLED